MHTASMPVPGEVTRHVPGQKAEASRTELITFAIGNEQYGVDIMSVREIKGWTDITHLPKQPDYVRGVLNLRGVMVPIIDLRCRLGEGLTDATPLHVVIIVQVGDQQIGLLADRVLDIVGFEATQVQPVPSRRAQQRHRSVVRPRHLRGRHDRADRPATSSHDPGRRRIRSASGGRLTAAIDLICKRVAIHHKHSRFPEQEICPGLSLSSSEWQRTQSERCRDGLADRCDQQVAGGDRVHARRQDRPCQSEFPWRARLLARGDQRQASLDVR